MLRLTDYGKEYIENRNERNEVLISVKFKDKLWDIEYLTDSIGLYLTDPNISWIADCDGVIVAC